MDGSNDDDGKKYPLLLLLASLLLRGVCININPPMIATNVPNIIDIDTAMSILEDDSETDDSTIVDCFHKDNFYETKLQSNAIVAKNAATEERTLACDSTGKR